MSQKTSLAQIIEIWIEHQMKQSERATHPKSSYLVNIRIDLNLVSTNSL